MSASFFMVPAEAYSRTDLNRNEKAVYTGLCSFADNESGKCWPSMNTLSKRTGLSRSVVKTAIKGLTEKGIIIKQNRKVGETSEADSNMYLIIGRADNNLRRADNNLRRADNNPQVGQIITQGRVNSNHKLYLNNYTQKTNNNPAPDSKEKKPARKSRTTADAEHPTLAVPMNQARYDSLCRDYGQTVVDRKIEAAVLHIESKGLKPYADYAAAAANFLKRDSIPKIQNTEPIEIPDFLKAADYE